MVQGTLGIGITLFRETLGTHVIINKFTGVFICNYMNIRFDSSYTAFMNKSANVILEKGYRICILLFSVSLLVASIFSNYVGYLPPVRMKFPGSSFPHTDWLELRFFCFSLKKNMLDLFTLFPFGISWDKLALKSQLWQIVIHRTNHHENMHQWLMIRFF